MLIICVTYDHPGNGRSRFTFETLASLTATVAMPRHRIIIVDNGSTDPQTVTNLKMWENWIGHSVIRNGTNLGTARAINKAISLRQPGEAVCKIDNDLVIHQSGWADEMEEVFARDPRYGLIGLKRKDLEQRPGHPNKWYTSQLVMLPHQKGQRWLVVEECADVMGTCIGLSSALLDKVGYFYQMGRLYGFDDTLMCVRARVAGFKIGFLPSYDIDHIDPGGSDFNAWKIKQAQESLELFNRTKEDFITGKRPVYCGPEDG